MKKIAIITFSCAFNYGAMLQTYGLYGYLKSKGYDVTVIDYIPERYNLDAENYPQIAFKRTRLWKYIPFSRTVWKKTRLAQMKENRANFRAFLERNVVLTHKYFSLGELEKDVPKADLYITGSDQVWNPDFVWNGGIDEPYYLAFLPKGAGRISYASSFGKNRLTEDESAAAEKFLADYNRLSTREGTGVEILDNMGLEAVETADPTILAGADLFRKLAETAGKGGKEENYMLLFQIHFNQRRYDICKAAAGKRGLKFIPLIPDVFQASKYHCREKVVLPAVEEWIGYLMNASYIVTDSFHATVFSIMFKKSFTCWLSGRYNDRVYYLLDRVGLEDRILADNDIDGLMEQFDANIHYDSVNNKFAAWQADSRAWLDRAVAELA